MLTALQDCLTRLEFPTDGASPRVSARAGRDDLCHLFAAMGYRRGAEVGVWEGSFSQRICQANPGVHLTCVDPWRWYKGYLDAKNDAVRLNAAYEHAVRRLAAFNCTFLTQTSLEAASSVPNGSLDFVYIDGNHAADFVWQDLTVWSQKVRAGGIVSGHDYSERKAHIQVKPMVDRFTREMGIDPWFVVARDKSPSFFWVQA